MVLGTLVACQPIKTANSDLRTGKFASPTTLTKIPDVKTISGLVMLAEAKLASDDAKMAVSLYLEAASQSRNPQVAERAAFLARQAGTSDQIEEALGRWQDIDPNSHGLHEATIIYAAEHSQPDLLQSSLTKLVNSDADYRAHWLASFWLGLPEEKQQNSLKIMARVARDSVNGSLAMVVAEAKNRIDSSSGTEWLDAWIELQSPPANVVLFRSRLELPERKRAIDYLERFVEISQDVNIRAQLARWHGLEGDSAKALTILRGLIEDDSSRHQDLLTLSILELRSGSLDAAERHLKALLASEQYRSDAYYYLGELALIEELHNLAIDRFLRVDSGELIIEARKQLASLALKNNDSMQADRWFSESRLLFPNFELQLNIAEAQFRTANNRAGEAIPQLTEALSRDPESIEILYTRALAFEQLDNIDAAEKDLRRILELKPNDPDALNALGYTLADRTDRYEEALVLIKAALLQKPESAAILDSMGWVLLKLGQLESAESYFTKAWGKSRDHEIAAHYGELLWLLGRPEDAREIWRIGYESNPESDKIRRTMKRLTNS